MKQTRSYLLGSSPTIAFVSHPLRRGCWLKTDACVLFVECPHCKQVPGTPCLGSQSYTASTHYRRREEFQKAKSNLSKKIGRATVPAFVIEPEIMVLLGAIGMENDG